jgi:HK97 family phage major capsid protein
MNSFDYKAKREGLVADLRTLQASITDTNAADMNPKIDAKLAEISACDADITRAVQVEAFTASPVAPKADTAKAEQGAAALGMDSKELKNYSILRAIKSVTDGTWFRENSLEREASEATAKALGKSPKGFYIPQDVLTAPMKAALRDGTTTAGGYTVATDLLSGSFIDMLRNRMVVYRGGAGARILNGLVGDVAIPTQTGGATLYWVAEGTGTNGTVTASDQTFGQVAMTPKTAGAATEISRKLMLQSSLDVESFVREDLAMCVATGIDLAALAGTGQSNQPTGVISTSSINTIDTSGDGSVPTWADLVSMETALADDNADTGALAYACTPGLRGYFKSTPKVASTDSVMLWQEGATPLNGYGAFVSKQLPQNLAQNSGTNLHALLFGNWNDLIIGFWSGLDVLVNPYAHDLAGAVRIVMFQDVDIAVRHAESFCLRKCTIA